MSLYFFIGITLIIGGLAGGALGAFVLCMLDPKRKQPRVKPHVPQRRTEPARPFRERLAQFADEDEEHVMREPDFRSTMPFWSIVEAFRRVPPKSVQWIRELLLRIRRASERIDGPDISRCLAR